MFQFERQILDRFLKTLRYPLDKQQVIDASKNSNLPPQIVRLLQRLDERPYDSAEDVEQDLAAHKV